MGTLHGHALFNARRIVAPCGSCVPIFIIISTLVVFSESMDNKNSTLTSTDAHVMANLVLVVCLPPDSDVISCSTWKTLCRIVWLLHVTGTPTKGSRAANFITETTLPRKISAQGSDSERTTPGSLCSTSQPLALVFCFVLLRHQSRESARALLHKRKYENVRREHREGERERVRVRER